MTESELAKLMRDDWQLDLDSLMQSGRVPNWIELENLLQRDEYRVMSLIADHAGYVMSEPVNVSYGIDTSGLFPVDIVRHVDSLTRDAGFDSPGNCKATVNRCIDNGWIVKGQCKVTGATRYDLTQRGQWVIDLVENDKWFEGDV